VLNELLQASINFRLEKARECLRDAEKNFEDKAYSNAANRSYYCIFHAMRTVLIIDGFSSKTHSGNIAEFRRRYIKTKLFPVYFSDIIGRAFEIRKDSDYDDFYVISEDEVEQQVKNAKIFLDAAESYINSLQ
jgi:uncharacterized protein (UPF0332 family)